MVSFCQLIFGYIAQFFIVLWCMSACPALAWNALGHRLIAQIAYDQFDASTKKKINHYNHQVNLVYKPPLSFVNAGPWLDSMRDVSGIARPSMHYIDNPWSLDGTPTRPARVPNAVTAINGIIARLQQPSLSSYEKGIHLRELEHLIGDLHQPLHAIDGFSKAHPQGDRGGNLLLLKKSPIGNNLHRYWDNGGGLLLSKKKLTRRAVQQMAKQIEQQWPCQPDNNSFEPQQWARQSYHVAIQHAYVIHDQSILSVAYAWKVQEISARQISLAGCRLYKILSSMDS